MPDISPMMPDLKVNPIVFLKEVRAELVKVIWPTKDEVIKLSTIVIIVSLALGLYIGGLDAVLTKIVDFLIKR